MTRSPNRILEKHSLLAVAFFFTSVIGVESTSAQSQTQSQRNDAIFHQHILPQQQAAAAAEAEIRSRPSNFMPGEIRDNVQYGALAWYEKSPGQYGYVFNKGNIRDISASMNVEIECARRKIKCENMRVVANEWLAIGSYDNRVHFATATGASRAAAEANVQEQCAKDGTTCTIKETFDVTPHRRGVTGLRQVMIVR